ncbi:MAG: putative Ig domain-containing protein, partial [Nanoarchaeota archaeon]|nr:putative Ig domain-containing protein [Nanoarchaeota archaeon]
MKKLTLILIACVFSIFFLNVASAIVVSGGFDGQESNIAIKNGDSAEFYVETFSMSLPMEISIEVFDSNDKLIHTFEGNTEVGLSTFEKTYTLTKNIYENEGDFRIVIIGSDESQSTRTQTLFLKVTETNEEPTPTENTAPRINSIQTIKEITEGNNYEYQVTAEDDEGDAITYEFFGPSWLSMNPETNVISGTAPSVDANQGYNFGVKVSDNSRAFTYKIYSLKVIDSEGSNNAPVASSRNWEVDKNTPKNITLIAQDANKDSLTYSIVVNPVNGALSEFDSATGKVTYTPKKDFVGSDSFTFKAKD